MKYWVGILCVVLVLGWIIAWSVWPFLEYQAMASVPPNRYDVVTHPDGQITGMQLMAQLGGRVALRVTARYAVFPGTRQRAVVQGVNASIVQEAGRVWHVSAAQGLVNRTTGDLAVQGDVRLYEQDGYRIETNRLYLHTADRVLHTDESVVIRGHAVTIAGTGLRHEIDENRIVLLHHVKASFQHAGRTQAVEAPVPLDTSSGHRWPRSDRHGTALRESKSDAFAGH